MNQYDRTLTLQGLAPSLALYVREQACAAGLDQWSDAIEIADRLGDQLRSMLAQEQAATANAAAVARAEEEQAKRDRLTERDPEVQEAREALKMISTPNLALLREHGSDLTDAQLVAIGIILANRATEQLQKVA